MPKNISLLINNSILEKAVKKLIYDLLNESTEIIKLEQVQDLWDVFESLDLDKFILLKKNIYFADFLRSIRYSIKQNDTFVLQSLDSRELNNSSVQNSSLAEQTGIETLISEQIVDQTTPDEIKPVFKSSMLENTINIELPSPDTPLDDVVLPDRFLKLIKRLRNISLDSLGFELGNTLNHVLSITDDEFTKISGVGLFYHSTLNELKVIYQEADLFNQELGATDAISFDINNMRLTYSGIDKRHVKSLDKLASYLDVEDLSDEIQFILQLDRLKLMSFPGIGATAIQSVLSVKDLIKTELNKIQLGTIDFENFESQLIIPKEINRLTVERFGELLLEDIDAYIDKLDEREQDIIQKRWNFVEKKQTLEEIGSFYGVERERIRQIEKKITDNLSRNLRLSRENIWQMLEPILTPELPKRLKDLSSCFNNEADFYELLSVISDQVNLHEYVQPVIRPNLLNKYFTENGGPVSYEDIKEYLTECDFENVKDVDNAILFLASKGNIKIQDGEVWPKKLRKPEATAYVLANHPNGLPWADVAKYVNNRKCSNTAIPIDRLDSEAFKSTEHIFLSGKGTYKHTRYIDFSLLSPDEIFDEMLSYIDVTGRDVFHLNECYRASKSLQKQDYYVVRFIVKHYGEEYGFFFNGRSQTDSVGLEKNFKHITQRDVILEAMKENVRPLTSTQVANLLKSKSHKHASFYLDQMMEKVQIVQVDRMLYTTPELAYKNIDLALYFEEIRKILVESDKPVEPSFFKNILNTKLSASYSKYFYASIARKYSNEQGWYRKQSLYSINPIPFKSLSEAIEIYCALDQSLDQNIIALNQHIAISRDTAALALSRWRRGTLLEIN